MFCNENDVIRHTLWLKLHEILGSDFEPFCNLSPDIQLLELLGGLPSFPLQENVRISCFKLILRKLHSMCKVLNI